MVVGGVPVAASTILHAHRKLARRRAAVAPEPDDDRADDGRDHEVARAAHRVEREVVGAEGHHDDRHRDHHHDQPVDEERDRALPEAGVFETRLRQAARQRIRALARRCWCSLAEARLDALRRA